MPCPVLRQFSRRRPRLCCATAATAGIRRHLSAAPTSAAVAAAAAQAQRQVDRELLRQPSKQQRFEAQRTFTQPPTATGAPLTRWGKNALAHFDQLYGPEFGLDLWPSVRLALLSPPKHAAVLNRFHPDLEAVEARLLEAGAEDLAPTWRRDLSAAKAAVAPMGGAAAEAAANMKPAGELKVLSYDRPSKPAPPAARGDAMSARSSLDEFVPATEFITEMDPRGRASPTLRHLEALPDAAETSALPVPDDGELAAPANPADPGLWLPCDLPAPPATVRVFAFPAGCRTPRFPRPRPDRATGLCPYLPLDLGSVASALALSPADGDAVLDLCAAPGAKAFCLMQWALPGRLLCLDKSSARSGRLARLLGSHVPPAVLAACSVSQVHANALTRPYPASGFDRVLVDPTCSADRHSLNDASADLFSGGRSRERVRLPTSQLELLLAGAEACRVGGRLVYSTCTMSPVQNEAVVLTALGRLGDRFKLVDLRPLAALLTAADGSGCRVQVRPAGLLVLPYLLSNYGPTYICKLQRVQ